jgi:hypothetical protein
MRGTLLLRIHGTGKEERWHGPPPGFTASDIAQTRTASMRTSETPRQLTKRLEMGQGRPVHFFIALRGKEI